MDARGYCTVEGRLKDMIIRGGENIYPRELEELLFRHPKVGEVAVIGVPHEKWGEEVAAFIRPAPGAVIDKGRTDRLHARLARPAQDAKALVRGRDAFPLTGSGKIQKFKLREAWTKGEMTAIQVEGKGECRSNATATMVGWSGGGIMQHLNWISKCAAVAPNRRRPPRCHRPMHEPLSHHDV